jgi:hypothetical protein
LSRFAGSSPRAHLAPGRRLDSPISGSDPATCRTSSPQFQHRPRHPPGRRSRTGRSHAR